MTNPVQSLGALQLATLTGFEQDTVVSTGALGTYATTGQQRDAAGYLKVSPASGATVNFGTSTQSASILVISGSGTISTLTIALSPVPVDGQRALIFANQAVSTLTMSVSTGQTLNAAATSLTQNVAEEWVYSASNSTWDRCQ